MKTKLPALLMTLAMALGLSLPVQAKMFRWAFQGDAQSLDPYSLNETFTLGFLGNVYEGLVRRNAGLKLEPDLATSWELLSPTHWRFHLRKGVKFQNGDRFTADDVIFSYHRVIADGSDLVAYLAGVQKVVKVDDYTVDFITEKPDPTLINQWEFWYMMDKKWCEEHGAAKPTNIAKGVENYATRHANGTGPFMIKSREVGVKTVFVPNPNWWDKPRHNLTEAVFTPIKQDATRISALLSDQIDMAYPVPVQDIARINRSSGTKVMTGPELRTIFLGFDQHRDQLLYSSVKGKNPFKDKRVRQAFYQAIAINAIKQKVMRGRATPAATLISPKLFPLAKDFKRLPYDPGKARKLLAAAGYPKGFEVGMVCPNNRYVNDEKICQAVVAMLAKVGVKIDLTTMPKSKYFARIKGPNYDMSFYMLGWTPSSLDSWNVLYNLADTVNPKTGAGQFNYGRYSNAEVDRLTGDIQVETDQAKRNRLIKKAFEQMNNDVAYIPLHQQALAWGVRSNVHLGQRADNVLMLRDIQLK